MSSAFIARRRAATAAALCLALSTAHTIGQERGRTEQPSQPASATRGDTAANRTETTFEDRVLQTSHTMRLDGREIKYTATAGTLPIRLDDEKIAAHMFFVAYTKDGEDARSRPVSFLYNGGPGSATVWLHMGSFGPVHVQMAEDGFQPVPPSHLVENENSLLNVTDLVFIQNRYMDMTEALRATMTPNPFLRVFVAHGYYDGATPIGGSEFNFSHVAYDASVTSRVSFSYYEAGHMIYIRPSAHKQLSADIAAFIRAGQRPQP